MQQPRARSSFSSTTRRRCSIISTSSRATTSKTQQKLVLVAVMATALSLSTTSQQSVNAFRPSCATSSLTSKRIRKRNVGDINNHCSHVPSSLTTTALFSSVGGGNQPPPNDGNNNNKGSDFGDLGDFLDPSRPPDSENLKRAREFMSETSLPLSFDSTTKLNGDNDKDDDDGDEDDTVTPTIDTTSGISSSLTTSNGSKFNNSASSSALFGTDGTPSSDILAKNPYMQVVSKISPSEVIAKFTATANPRVQEAVRTTILGLIGTLPKLAFETTSITTGQRLASLMFQLQMTGYMFKNAEYRMSMSQSLGMYSEISSNLLLTGSKDNVVEDDDHDIDELLLDRDDDPLLSGKIKGKLKIRYAKGSNGMLKPQTNNHRKEDSLSHKNGKSESDDDDGMEIEVDAAAYMSELRSEVSKLRDELAIAREAKDEALKKDLLLYIRTLPAQELKSLTNTMSQDVLVCMKGLVQAVLAGIGDGQIGPDTVTEQSGEAMAQLCMWQLAVGYNLRELEVREEMKKNLQTILGEDKHRSEPGAFE